jgi:hypothetical protein
MGLQVLTRSSTENLVDLATVKTRLGITDTSKDALLGVLITGASSAIADYWGRPFARQQYSEARCGNGRLELLLPRYPIDADSLSVTVDGVTVTDYVVIDREIGKVYRPIAWNRSYNPLAPLNVAITWKGGYVLPDQVTKWTSGAVLTLGGWVKPTSPASSPWLFEVTTPGTLSGSEPNWSTVTATGQTIALGGGPVGTARDAQELPPKVADLCYVEVFHRFQNVPPGLAAISGDGFSESYFATHTETDLCNPVRAGLDRMRVGIA